MKRRFNITGSCNWQQHYMVKLDDRLKRIQEDYVDEGCYFVINRGRQYGKTTTLKALAQYLKEEYIVLSMDFQRIGTEEFVNAETFAYALSKKFLDCEFPVLRISMEKQKDLLKSLEEFADDEKTGI